MCSIVNSVFGCKHTGKGMSHILMNILWQKKIQIHVRGEWPIWGKVNTDTYLTSKARANIPAARGAEADVPVCESVHRPWRSVVTLDK